jgi:hypothetical protein
MTERENYELEKARIHYKLPADKIIQGLEKLNDASGERAIWELFQNAVDASDNACKIVIEQTEKSLDFRHNGNPFTTKTLSSLIMQTSHKEKNNEDEKDMVGQFGTGFITAHCFGKVIKLSGSLASSNGNRFLNFKDFEIDRKAENSDQLIKKLQQQEKQLEKWVDALEEATEGQSEWTVFSYQTETDKEKENVSRAITTIPALLPYVMAINEKLLKVTIIDRDKNCTVYEKDAPQTEDDLTITPITINQEKRNIYSICNDDIIIILPLSEKDTAFRFDRKIPKLFLCYPLIGTESFGFNYIVHSKQFEVTEPRDGIHLEITNDQIKKKVEQNRAVLTKVFTTAVDFVKKHHTAIKNRQHLAVINFDAKTDYFKDFKKHWVDAFKTIPLVQKSDDTFITPLKAQFFGQALLKRDDHFDAIYAIVNIFCPDIPRKEIAKEWRDIVVDWEDNEKREINFIQIKVILEKIQAAKTLGFFEEKNAVEHLQTFYQYLIAEKRTSDFDAYTLLPNIKHELRKKTDLRAHTAIPEVFVEIADVIMPKIPKQFIKEGFTFDLALQNYDKKAYSKDINEELSKYKIDVSDEKNILPENVYKKLLMYCTVFNSSEDTGKIRALTALIGKFKGLPDLEIPDTADIDWKTPVQCLLRNFICELYHNLSKPNNGISLQIYYDLLSITYEWAEVSDIIKTLPVFPNQKRCICVSSALKTDGDIPEEMKVLYDEIVAGKDKPSIKAVLLDKKCSDFLLKLNGETRKPENVAQEINVALEKFDINEKNVLPPDVYQKLMTYCTVFNPAEDNDKRKALVDLIWKYKNFAPLENTNTTQATLDWKTPVRTLLKNYVFELKNKSEFDLQVHNAVLSVVSSWKDVQELVETLPLFPNQNKELCKKSELEIDGDIPYAMKQIFDKVVNSNKNSIKDVLLHSDFNSFLVNGKKRDVENVAYKIEKKLTEIDVNGIKNHPFKDEIMQIIEYIDTDAKWAKYFPNINDEKETISYQFTPKEARKIMHELSKDSAKMASVKNIVDSGNLDKISENLDEFNAFLDLDEEIKDVLIDPEMINLIRLMSSDPEKASRIEQAFSDVPLEKEDRVLNVLSETISFGNHPVSYQEQITKAVPITEIKTWWDNLSGTMRNQKVDDYYSRLFPYIQGFDLRCLADSESNNYYKSWFILFATAVLQQIGRVTNEQNKNFIADFLNSRGWLDTMANTSDPTKWIDIFIEYIDNDSEEWQHWTKHFFQLFKIRKYFDDYINIFTELNLLKNKFSIDTVLIPRSNPALSGSGLYAPSVRRTLRIGASLIIRELLRNGVLPKDEKIVEHAFMPKEYIEQTVFSSNDSNITSREIYAEIKRKLGVDDIFTFDDYYDIPVLIYQKEHQ